MTAIDVTPAGNQLYSVDIRDEDGSSTHTVTVPDQFLDQVNTDGVSVQDLVFAALAFLTSREGHHELDEQVDLAEVAERYEGFTERIAALARQRTLQGAQDTGTGDERPSGDDRLLAEVKQEQREGEVTSTDDKL
jgi:hypothetical protein